MRISAASSLMVSIPPLSLQLAYIWSFLRIIHCIWSSLLDRQVLGIHDLKQESAVQMFGKVVQTELRMQERFEILRSDLHDLCLDVWCRYLIVLNIIGEKCIDISKAHPSIQHPICRYPSLPILWVMIIRSRIRSQIPM